MVDKEKLAKWAGIKTGPLGGCPNFPESQDACFKYLVPRLIKDFATELVIVFEYLPHYDSWTVAIEDSFYEHNHHKRILSCASNKQGATALCKAIEKLIDEEK